MRINFILLLLLFSYTISAQLIITPGAQFSVALNTQLTLQNTDLINNGNFITVNNRTSFTGNAVSSISGNQPIQFSGVEINKINNSSVKLLRAIGVTDRVLFTAGLLDLNGSNVDLGTTGHLEGEQESTRVIGPNGGEVLFTTNLNLPANANPANLGLIITSNQNLGNVTIRRGHQSQPGIPLVNKSILRYYDVAPANNVNLNATLRFKYFDGELNGTTENSLTFYKSDNTINWSLIGFTSRDISANFVERTGTQSMSRFTLSSGNDVPLPVNIISLNGSCETNRIVIKWKTAQEQGSSHFNVERSEDAAQWTVIGSVPAAGNSFDERNYSFDDNNPTQNGYYRIAQYDLDGSVRFTQLLRPFCDVTGLFVVSPNPFHDAVFINMTCSGESQATIRIFDDKGALVKLQRSTIVRGLNQLRVDLTSMTNGSYILQADWDNGNMRKSIQILKQ